MSRKIRDENVIYVDDKLKINHYKSKSKEEWELKLKTVNNYGYMAGKWQDRPFEYYDKNDNEVEDKRILRYVKPLREIMQKEVPKNPKSKPYFLVMVCMFRLEQLYLKEWIDYHRLQGVDHFYLYDNENPKWALKVLKPYIKNNWVTLIKWPDSVMDSVDKKQRRGNWSEYDKVSTQTLAFEHFAKNFKNEFVWALKADVDEFIHPSREYKNTRDVLKKEFDRSKIKGLVIKRTNFGSNGHIKKPNNLVIKSYTKCEKRYSSYKSIGNSRFIKNPSCSPHKFDYA